MQLALDVGWRRRPLTVEDAAERTLRMLTLLGDIDERFRSFLTGGNSPDPGRGWRPLPSTAEELRAFLDSSDPEVTQPGVVRPPLWRFGAWNGRNDETSIGIGIHVEGTGPTDRFAFRSAASMNGHLNGLNDAQIATVVAAFVDAWDPDEGERTDIVNSIRKVTVYKRDTGWS